MCYPKPGPRCSAYAAAAYAKAHQKVLDAFMGDKADPELNRLVKLREKARQEYAITPAGIREKERAYNSNPTEWAKAELQKVKEERERRLQAVKDKKPTAHKLLNQKIIYTPTPALQNGDTPEEMRYSHPNLLTSLKDSEKWAHNLTDEELETVAWYSQGGFGNVNGHLSNPEHTPLRGYSKKKIEKAVKILDKAFSKYEPNVEGVTVYRRHLSWTGDYSYENLSSQEIQKRFQPGTIYRNPSYLSTSLNPDNLPTNDETVTGMEILTKTGVPITSVSSQGPREYEFIIPRGKAFKIISNDVKVSRYDRMKKENVNVVIIRLEEI